MYDRSPIPEEGTRPPDWAEPRASDRLVRVFQEQRELQLKMPPLGREPWTITNPEQRVQFIKDMTLALEDELHEFLNEVGWKPWATSRHVHEEEAKGELVDAFHFFMNLCMVVHMGPEELFVRYMEKRLRNEARQAAGYDGVEGKCQSCHRAFDDLAKAWGLPLDRVVEEVTLMGDDIAPVVRKYCLECAGGTVIVDD